METLVKVIPIQQLYAFPKDIMTLIGRGKTATHYITKEYQEFVRERPNYFNPLTPLVDNTGETILDSLSLWRNTLADKQVSL